MTIEEIMKHDPEFKYRLLSRMQADCEYFLGNGGRHPKHLWACTVEEHIEYMKSIWKNLKDKPEWLTYEQIENYQSLMVA